jgi:hypothetical protein
MYLKKLLIAIGIATVVLSCSKEQTGQTREDKLSFHAQADCSDEPMKEAAVSVLAGTRTLYLKSSFDKEIDLFWQDAATYPWAKIEEFEPTGTKGVYRITLSYPDRYPGVWYARRVGTLSAVVPGEDFGVFLPVRQGATDRVVEDFSAWTYGSADPWSDISDTPLDNWTTALKDRGFSSEHVGSDTLGRCYGRVGYIRLGDKEAHRGSVLTPRNDSFRFDTLLMVSFRAAAFKEKVGSKDDNHFRVEVTGGGFIRDYAETEQTWIDLEAPYIQNKEDFFGSDSWFLVFIADSDSNQMTATTRIKITSGTDTSEGCSRLFLDDISITRLVPDVDEDFYAENEGSGKDKIMTTINTE